jgi:hypothetical protein
VLLISVATRNFLFIEILSFIFQNCKIYCLILRFVTSYMICTQISQLIMEKQNYIPEYVDTNLEIFLIFVYIPEHVDKNSCGFFDSIHGGDVSTTAVTTTIIKNLMR